MTNEIVYFPLIKSRDAELRCMENLSDDIRSSIMPIYELTKSRSSKKSPDGDIHRRMNQIIDIQKGRPFILDLNTSEKYINSQIEQLVSQEDGFYEWRYFLKIYKDANIIPTIHLYEDADETYPEVSSFVKDVSVSHKVLALRLPNDLDAEDIEKYLMPVKEGLDSEAKIIVIIDADFIRKKFEYNKESVISSFKSTINSLVFFEDIIDKIVMVCSSFPSSPAQAGKNDEDGEFLIYEELLFQSLKKYGIFYGDYASINTEQLDIRGGTFVPRIDISLSDRFIYKRYRREEGSYKSCAQKMKQDRRYVSLNCWADEEISIAAALEPTGRNPSFWISVRMCYYITSRVRMRSQGI